MSFIFFFTAWPEEEEACVSILISGTGFVGQRLRIVKTRVCDDFDGVLFLFFHFILLSLDMVKTQLDMVKTRISGRRLVFV